MHNKTEKILAAFLLRFSTFISENSRFIQKLLDLNVSNVGKLNLSKFFTDIRITTVFSTYFLIVHLLKFHVYNCKIKTGTKQLYQSQKVV